LTDDAPTLVLGIETTCDETAAAVVERQRDGSARILSNIVRSQVAEHAAFGGVVPEIAARAHVEALDRIIAKAMAEALATILRDERMRSQMGDVMRRRVSSYYHKDRVTRLYEQLYADFTAARAPEPVSGVDLGCHERAP